MKWPGHLTETDGHVRSQACVLMRTGPMIQIHEKPPDAPAFPPVVRTLFYGLSSGRDTQHLRPQHLSETRKRDG